MAKNRDQTGGGTAAANPEQITREIEGFLSQKQTAISQAIDQLLQNKKEVDRKAEESKRAIDEQVEKLNELYHKATNRYYVSSRKSDSNGAAGEAKRGRRSRDELQADARAIIEFVQSKGKDGVGGGEIKGRFTKITGGIKDFVKKYAGVSLKTEGEKAQMRYFAAQ